MKPRLLAGLQPQRRLLTSLVGLLVLTFVLTAVLAYHAHWSTRRLERVSDRRLDQASAQVAIAWGDNLENFLGSELVVLITQIGATLLQYPDEGLEALRDELGSRKLCTGCETEDQVVGYYIAGRGVPRDSLGGPIPARAREQVWAEIAGGSFQPVHEQLGFSVHFVSLAGRIYPTAAITVIDETGAATRTYAVVLTEIVVRQMLALAFRAQDRVRILSGAHIDSVFVFQAAVNGVTILPSTPQVTLTGRELLRSKSLRGVELMVGVKPGAESTLTLYTRNPANVVVLVALLGLIGGLIALAVLLVRKEAELIRLRADFVSSVTHELRTPLAQIRMFTETLLLGRVRSDVERRRSLEIIDQEAVRLQHLVENVLAFSKSEGGRTARLALEPTPFAAEVDGAIASFAPMGQLRNVEIRAEVQENLAVHVDRSALRQILVNLIDNALKYGPVGQRVTVSAALFGVTARLWVDDEGPGVPEADRERVFDSFVRMQRDVESRRAGSGIGLAVVRELARLHGGRAWVESAPGSGARFTIELPEAFLRTEPSSSTGLAAAS